MSAPKADCLGFRDFNLRVESKDEMRAEGRHSRDRGEAVLGCIVCGSRLTGAVE